MSYTCTMRTRGFTLIEMMMVVTLLGLLAGGAMLSFGRPLRAMRARQAVEQFAAFDAAARQAARRSGRAVQIIIDLSNQQILREEESRRGDRQTQTASMVPLVRIEQVRTGQRASSAGRVAIRCSPGGFSASYAVRLHGPDAGRWLLVAGMSGQITEVRDESQVQVILAGTPSRRNTD